MLAAERRSRIVDEVRRVGMISTEDLSGTLGVSGETIRRDLVALEGRGLLLRVHGGASASTPVHTGEEAPFVERSVAGAAAKDRIGEYAARLVRPGQTVVIDVGTTAQRVARFLPRDFVGTVATCSLLVATELADRPGVEVLVCGGRLRKGDLAISGGIAEQFFADLNPDIAFLGSGGVESAVGLTDFHLDEVSVRRTIIRNSARSLILADATKFGRVAPYRVVPLDAVTGLVTDQEPPLDIREAFEQAGGEIHTAARTSTATADHPRTPGT